MNGKHVDGPRRFIARTACTVTVTSDLHALLDEHRDYIMASQLLAAAKKGDVNAIAQALQAGGIATIDVADDFGNAAIHCAALKGHAGAVELLLKSKANPDAVGNVSRRRNPNLWHAASPLADFSLRLICSHSSRGPRFTTRPNQGRIPRQS